MKNKLIGVLIVVGVLAIPFAMGGYGNLYNRVIGGQAISVEHENFKNSTTYIDGKIDDLARYKKQYDDAENINDKIAIENHIRDEFSNFDSSKIKNNNLRSFLESIQ